LEAPIGLGFSLDLLVVCFISGSVDLALLALASVTWVSLYNLLASRYIEQD
jgi:hypothetical protein